MSLTEQKSLRRQEVNPRSLLHAFASLLLLGGRADVLGLASLSVLPDLVLAAKVSIGLRTILPGDTTKDQ